MGHKALGTAKIEPFKDISTPEGNLLAQRARQGCGGIGRHGIERRDRIGLHDPAGHLPGEVLAGTPGEHPHHFVAGHRRVGTG